MPLVGMHTAVADESHDVEGRTVLAAVLAGRNERRILEEGTVVHCPRHSSEVLVHHGPGPEVQMADFRVPHLTIRQADGQTGSGDHAVRVQRRQSVKHRGAGGGHGVTVRIVIATESIHDHQHDRAYGGKSQWAFCMVWFAIASFNACRARTRQCAFPAGSPPKASFSCSELRLSAAATSLPRIISVRTLPVATQGAHPETSNRAVWINPFFALIQKLITSPQTGF